MKTVITDREGNWKTDKPSRVGATHIWFRDMAGMVVIRPLATLSVCETAAGHDGKFECDGHSITVDTFTGIVRILDPHTPINDTVVAPGPARRQPPVYCEP